MKGAFSAVARPMNFLIYLPCPSPILAWAGPLVMLTGEHRVIEPAAKLT